MIAGDSSSYSEQHHLNLLAQQQIAEAWAEALIWKRRAEDAEKKWAQHDCKAKRECLNCRPSNSGPRHRRPIT